MANPTRAAIESIVVHPNYKVEIWSPDHAEWFHIPNMYIESADGSIETTGNSDNGLSFGNAVEPSASVTVEAVILGDYLTDPDKALFDDYWLLSRMRISYTLNGGWDTPTTGYDFVTAFVGVIQSITLRDNMVVFDLVGLFEYIRKTKLYTNLEFRRAIATKTTASSVEDPDDVSYAAGTINEIFWRSGGRPYEQAVTYPESSDGFKFYYSCTDAICSPDWTWLSGENLEEELYSLARAGGGQVYQDQNGVIRYINPLMFGTEEDVDEMYTISESHYVSSEIKRTAAEKVNAVNCLYTGRIVQPVEIIYEENTPRLFMTSESKTIELTTQLPIYEYTNLDASTIFNATYLNGDSVTPTITASTTTATKITLTIENPSATQPMVIHNIKIHGRPLEATEENLVVVGSGIPVMNVDNNPYIQNRYHARMVAQMTYDFYSVDKIMISVHGYQFDTDRYVGELVMFAFIDYLGEGGISSNLDNRRITRIAYTGTGTGMDIDMVSMGTLPIKEDHFIIGTTYADGDTKLLSY